MCVMLSHDLLYFCHVQKVQWSRSLVSQILRLELSRFVLFGNFPESCGKSKNCKNLKKSQNPEKSQKSEKVEFLAVWRLPYVIRQNPDFSTFGTFLEVWSGRSDFWIGPPDSQKLGPEKCQKSAKILVPESAKKIENFGLYAVGTTRRKWRQISLRGGKKSAIFSTFLRVKQKNVPFSAILSVSVISRFFSKSRVFEGQCQRDLPKGSQSCPVIFHRGGNWKWSIYRGQIPGSDLRTALSGRSPDLAAVWTWPPDSSSPEVRSRQRSGQVGARIRKSGQNLPNRCRTWFWPESCQIRKSARIAKIRTFGQKSRFWRIWRFPDPTRFWRIRIQDAIWRAHVWAHVHNGCQDRHPTLICTACSRHARHMYTCTSCQRHTRTCIHHPLMLHVLNNRALWK